MVQRERIRKGVSAVVFRIKNNEPEFLILHRVKRWNGWEMLKGGRIGREKPLSNLKRELREEIGASEEDIVRIVRLPFKLKFKTPLDYVKKYKYTGMEFQSFLVEYKGKINISRNEVKEHDEYKWVSYKDALRLLTYDTSKKQLEKAYQFMKSKLKII